MALASKIPYGKKDVGDYLNPHAWPLFPTSPQEIVAKYSRSKEPNNIDPLIARKSIGAVADLLGENYLTTRFLQV